MLIQRRAGNTSDRQRHLAGLTPLLLSVLVGQACGESLRPTGSETGEVHRHHVETVAGNGRDVPGDADGQALQRSVSQPFGITIGPDGALYICEVGSHRVRRVNLATGELVTVAGSGRGGYSGDGGIATAAELNEPYEVRFDRAGRMVFVEMRNHVVRRVDPATGLISTIAGTGTAGFSGDGRPATEAQFRQPHSIVLDAADNIYVCDIGNHRIRRIDAGTGIITTCAGTGEKSGPADQSPVSGSPLNGPRALAIGADGTFWLALREGNALFRTQADDLRWFHQAGTGRSGYTGDGGPARMAQLAGPKGIALAPGGDVYFADTESHTVRVLRARSGTIETVIGDGTAGDGPDGEPRSCRLNRPHGVYVSADGWLYVGDSNNHRVRRLRIE